MTFRPSSLRDRSISPCILLLTANRKRVGTDGSDRESVACVRCAEEPVSRLRDSEPSTREIGHSPDPPSTTQALRVAGIEPRLARHGFEDRTRGKPGARPGIASSNPRAPTGGQGSVIPSKLQPGLSPLAGESAEHRYAHGSQWREIRECMAMVWPMALVAQPVRGGEHRPVRAKGNLRGGHTREYCYRRRSSAAAFVAQFPNLLPGGSREMRMQPMAFKCGFAKAEFVMPFVL